MGLGQIDSTGPTMLHRWLLPGAMAAVSLVAGAAGGAGRLALRFDREGIRHGEVWRFLTGHFAHLGWPHLLMNVAGLYFVWLLVGARLGRGGWCFVIAATAAGIDLGLWLLDPGLDWYVGLSGLLHGMLMAGLVAAMLEGSREAAVLSLLIVVKVLWEQFYGSMPGSESLAGGAVVVNAHLYGAVAGAMAGLVAIRVGRPRPI